MYITFICAYKIFKKATKSIATKLQMFTSQTNTLMQVPSYGLLTGHKEYLT